MKFIADMHIHSHFSIATSKKLTPEHLDYWARLKGITVVGTGDFTHPGWLGELQEKLEPAQQGLFTLKPSLRINPHPIPFHLSTNEVRFLLTAEISCIYKRGGKVRKVHNVIGAPDFATAEKIQQALTKIGGNITSDGRPILGLDSRDLLAIALTASEDIVFIPAHIWTPWFSALGARSGFDTIAECYDDLSDHIYAVETGLSSDPAMNWLCSFLDKYTIISNSDAHSPEKLGREANIFNTDLSYSGITDALKTGDPNRFLGTIEFFPQEGKYHYDGHRKCGILWDPVETLRHKSICPKCNKPVTVGVMNRVVQLSDREDPCARKKRHPYFSIIPLPEILSEIYHVGSSSGKIKSLYQECINTLGPEFDILLSTEIEDIASRGYPELAEAVRRMRDGDVIISEGFDGEFGRIKVFQEHEQGTFSSQESLFDTPTSPTAQSFQKRKMINFDLAEYRRLEQAYQTKDAVEISKAAEPTPVYSDADPFARLNTEQYRAAQHGTGPALVLAGPGTGKTRVLTCRIADLVQNRGVNPENICAITFTNKAAQEMNKRLQSLLPDKAVSSTISCMTFHAFGLSILREHACLLGRTAAFTLIDESDKHMILTQQMGCDTGTVREIASGITDIKQNSRKQTGTNISLFAELFTRYETILQKQNCFDLDDLLYQIVNLFSHHPAVCTEYKNRFSWILIDEYQDINDVQYRMLKYLIAETPENLYAIGDPDQAIYGFRGADVSFIQSFTSDFPDAVCYTLKKSYRCSDHILKASGQILQKGDFLTGINTGVKITIASQSTEKSEAEFIARTIESMIGGLRFFSIDSQISEGNRHDEITSLSDFAVLCRISRQMQAIEKAFNDHSIPYQTIGERPLFKEKPIKAILTLLKLAHNPRHRLLKNLACGMTNITEESIPGILSLVKKQKSVRKKINMIIDSFFPSPDAQSQKLFNRLRDLSKDYTGSLEQFFTITDLGSSIDTYTPKTETVTIMTLHAAKGLEFLCVFIAGCEDGLLPYALVESQKSDYDEEKRLLYVGMTRAQKYLILSHAQKRFIFGKEYTLTRSPFLDRIEKELLEERKREYRRKEKEEDLQVSLF